ncbi:Gfo/Idh/MocA family protein [Polynucleobacter necessarius]|uniref:Gfo/Idh/MocA family protein n=1 Tax=Polynucleobacter necessarius TaxID=576610 RepID=UPI000E096B4F|nr:Gfo/Idh/MocA family oxidoreductase [Polynucleobacter necessarius]
MKFLVCGLGSIGFRHLRNLKALGYTDVIVYSSGKSVMPGVKEEIEKFEIYNSLHEALKQKPDVCMITNPTSLHVSVAMMAANAGCHLYIEKPLSNTLEKLDQLQKIVNNKKLTTFITYQFRFHPHIKLLKNIFADKKGEYGEALYVTTEWSEYLPDWHPWEDYKQSYSARRDLGGGVLLTQIHPMNYLSYIFGDIEKVQINKIATKILGIEVDDVADLMINFKTGMGGHVHIDFLQKPRVHAMKVVTSKGRFEWDYHENTLFFVNNDGKENIFKNDNFDRNDMFVEMLKDFINCVNLNQETKFNLDEAINELELLIS